MLRSDTDRLKENDMLFQKAIPSIITQGEAYEALGIELSERARFRLFCTSPRLGFKRRMRDAISAQYNTVRFN